MATVDFDLIEIKNEILNKLRYGLNSYDSKERITESTKTFAGDGTETKFLINATTMSYVKTITIGGILQKFTTDYTITWRGADKGKVIFTSAPADEAVILITVGNKATKGNFIYPDFPRTDLNINNYPRIGFKVYSNVKPAGLAGKQQSSNYELLLQIKIVGISTYNVDYLAGKTRVFVEQNAKNFYNIPFINLQTINEYDNFDDNTDTTFFKVLEFKIPDKVSTVEYTTAIN